MSSLSRRELARRRPGRAHAWRVRLLGVLVVATLAAAFVIGRGGV